MNIHITINTTIPGLFGVWKAVYSPDEPVLFVISLNA